MYADKVTDSMAATIEETARRREKQMAFNEANGMSPVQVKKEKRTLFEQSDAVTNRPKNYAAEPTMPWRPRSRGAKHGRRATRQAHGQNQKDMERAAKAMEFMEAARLRDELFALEARRKEVKGKFEA